MLRCQVHASAGNPGKLWQQDFTQSINHGKRSAQAAVGHASASTAANIPAQHPATSPCAPSGGPPPQGDWDDNGQRGGEAWASPLHKRQHASTTVSSPQQFPCGDWEACFPPLRAEEPMYDQGGGAVSSEVRLQAPTTSCIDAPDCMQSQDTSTPPAHPPPDSPRGRHSPGSGHKDPPPTVASQPAEPGVVKAADSACMRSSEQPCACAQDSASASARELSSAPQGAPAPRGPSALQLLPRAVSSAVRQRPASSQQHFPEASLQQGVKSYAAALMTRPVH